MDGGVQVIDELGADYGLGANELDGGERVGGVALQRGEEWRVEFVSRGGGNALQGLRGFRQILADLNAVGDSLRRIGKHELVALLDVVRAISELHRPAPVPRLAVATVHRSGSWCSR